jgi:hypothetical protein
MRKKHNTTFDKPSSLMFENGTYAAWFKTPLNQGAGLAHVADGKIEGGDSFMTYSGTYKFSGDRFTALLHTVRHTEGGATVFGVDNLTLRLEGKLVGKIASFTARADEVPDIVLEGTLIRSEEEDVAVKPRRTISEFDPRRLPTPPARAR